MSYIKRAALPRICLLKDAFHEAKDLISQVEAYFSRHGCYPEKVLVDSLYGSRENRRYLKEKGVHYAGKPLGRPQKETDGNKAELKLEKNSFIRTIHNVYGLRAGLARLRMLIN